MRGPWVLARPAQLAPPAEARRRKVDGSRALGFLVQAFGKNAEFEHFCSNFLASTALQCPHPAAWRGDSAEGLAAAFGVGKGRRVVKFA